MSQRKPIIYCSGPLYCPEEIADETFSKTRPVFYQGPVSSFKLLQPPCGPLANTIIKFMAWFRRC